MFTNRRSITKATHGSNTFNHNMLGIGLHSSNTFGTIQTTNGYNDQFENIFSDLNARRQLLQDKVSQLPNGNTSLRNDGVGLGWRYEQAEIEMGGKGSTNWSDAQRQEILNNGKVRGAEGHHINSVKNHPDQQANPDNIEFAKDRNEHLQKHGGDFRNPTEGDLIDRNGRLEEVNRQRVIKNELTGIGLAAAIGLGVGFTIGFVTTLAQKGIAIDGVKAAMGVGLRAGLESSMLATINHVIVRGIGETITQSLSQFAIQQYGFTLTENLIKMCNMATIGIVGSIVFSTWLFVKLRWKGHSSRFAFASAVKSLGTSLAILFISIIAQGVWGGYAGLIVSLSIGLSMVIFQYVKHNLNHKLLDNITNYSIEKSRPILFIKEK
ncbi:hypothetical protein [Bacillus sp. V5-8f]|uniref:hypothetical protein n=1 Tax=Bacillus sp. V5-8f TaxID=2053044 RepID=UPI000C75F821|nr:hypothetical protein [Bacillus sp. V5-8f]PLT33629.1 hypothetical protein CUU64_10890 [Bacillus sp. V5-8f]